MIIYAVRMLILQDLLDIAYVSPRTPLNASYLEEHICATFLVGNL